MNSVRKPWWQQATALVSISTGGAITGFSFSPGTPAELTTPTSIPVHLMALEKAARPAQTNNAALRSAIVNVANYYLRLAASRSPAEMEALIWQKDSIDGVDHGESCAAFASLTLELGAQAAGQESWVTGGASYPWPLHQWADVRVDPNPDSLNIISVLQDAQSHNRWHPLGDGYKPQPGDWVLFDGHVEVVTQYSGGVLYTIGGDSGANLSVNAHQYSAPLDGQGVVGFVNNGDLTSATSNGTQAPDNGANSQASGGATGQAPDGGANGSAAASSHGTAKQAPGAQAASKAQSGQAAIPGMLAAGYTPAGGAQAMAGAATPSHAAPGRSARSQPAPRQSGSEGEDGSGGDGSEQQPAQHQSASSKPASSQSGSEGEDGSGSDAGEQEPGQHQSSQAAQRASGPSRPATQAVPGGVASTAVPGAVPAAPAVTVRSATPGTSVIPGAPPADTVPAHPQATRATPHRRQAPAPAATSAPQTSSQQAFINEVAPGAIAAQHQWGVPASVTIAQAIEESTWGQSQLATNDNNLFGIKGNGPAGSVTLPTQEYENGQYVTIMAPFRVYHDVAESITDHGQLLATSGYYTHAMADRASPDAFANDLTGVYATDPNYGANLISLMRLYNLYRYDSAAPTATPQATGNAATQAAPTGTAHTAPTRHAHGAPVTPPRTGTPGGATIPGLQQAYTTAAYAPAATTSGYTPATMTAAYRPAPRTASSTGTVYARQLSSAVSKRPGTATQRSFRASVVQYQQLIPPSVMTAFITTAKAPLMRSRPRYKEVADQSGIRWELLAACDWMQCKAQPKYSPVHGEKLGTTNSDGTIYRTKSDALAQCATDLIELSGVVYGIDLTGRSDLSVDDLASIFAAFRWGGLLRRHGIPATDFPYSIAGLTARHLDMRWPSIDEADLPDKPGARFRKPFGAVPIILGLHYPAIILLAMATEEVEINGSSLVSSTGYANDQ